MPDFWRKPIQSDRNAHDYGHTRLTPDERPARFWPFALLIIAAIAWSLA